MKLLSLITLILSLQKLDAHGQGGTNSLARGTNQPTVNAPTTILENRLDHLEATTAVKFESLEVRLAHSQALLVGFGTFAGVVVAFLAIASAIRERRHHKDYRDERSFYENRVKRIEEQHREDYKREREFYEKSVVSQKEREEKRHAAEMTGVGRINEIMVVMKDLFENRKELEKEFKTALDEMKEKIAEAEKKVENALKVQKDSDTRFIDYEQKQKHAARQVWTSLNTMASELAKTGRHDFKNKHAELVAVRNRFEEFKRNHRINYPVDDSYCARLLYLSGIADHYSNDPSAAEDSLQRVISFGGPVPAKKGEQGQQDQEAEQQGAYNARIAISNYFLGVIALNCGDFQRAIDCLNEALKQEERSNKRDLLTRLVLAEAHASDSNTTEAEKLLNEVEKESLKMQDRGIDVGTSRRHCSRARLMLANSIIQQQQVDWQARARELLQKISKDDPAYYYATYTLAQTYPPTAQEAKELYLKAHDALRKPGELKTEGETRSNILQHMVAAICAYHGSEDKQECERLLGFAAGLVGKLPKSHQRECTVFSPLTKANEPPDIIKKHIERIQQGAYLECN